MILKYIINIVTTLEFFGGVSNDQS